MPRLNGDECRRRLAEARHAVLATVHGERGVDAVPVVLAMEGDTIWIPIDTVKPKTSTRLQRMANIAGDPRICVLVDHWGEDWRQLWWVRAHGAAHSADEGELTSARAALAARYAPYRVPGTVAGAIVVNVTAWSGWTAQP